MISLYGYLIGGAIFVVLAGVAIVTGYALLRR